MGCPVCGPPIPNFDIGCPVSDTILSTLKRHLSTFSHILPKEARLFFWGAEGSYGTAPRSLKIGEPAPIAYIACLSIGFYQRLFCPLARSFASSESRGKARNVGEKLLSLLCPLNVPFILHYS